MADAQNSPFEAIPQTLQYHELDQPDNQIRLLELSFDAVHQKINGQLKIVSFDHNPIYDAISYVWGDRNDLRQILVDGGLFNVTKNQQESLQCLYEKGCTTVWMDGVCIDQHNLQERNSQVANMKQIFQQADKVHVWLGPELEYDIWHKDYTQSKMEQIKQVWRDQFWETILVSEPSEPRDAGGEADTLGLDVIRTEFLQMLRLMCARTPIKQMPFYHIDPVTRQPLPRRSWYLVVYVCYEIYCSTWWERVWTVQEVVFAKSEPQIYLGRLSLPLMSVLSVCQYFLDENYYLDDSERSSDRIASRKLRKLIFPIVTMMRHDTTHLFQANTILDFRKVLNLRKVDGFPPELVFMIGLKRKVSDPRDFIYGLLGLLSDRYKSVIRPNYLDPDVKCLFRKASKYVVQASNGKLNLEISRGTVEAQLKTGDFANINVDEPTWGLSWGTNEPGLWKPRTGGRAHGGTKHVAPGNDTSLEHLVVNASIIGTVTTLGLRGSDRWRSGKNGYRNTKFELDVIDSWRLLAGLNGQHDLPQHSPELDERLETRFWRVLADGQPDEDSITGDYSVSCWLSGPASDRKTPWTQRIDGPNPRFKWKLLKEDLAKDHAERARCSVAELENAAEMSVHRHTKQKVLFQFQPTQESSITYSGPPIAISRLSTQVGDTLAILKGCQWPVVLRSTQQAGVWQFVGPAYIDELVDGQWVTPDTRWTSLTLV